MACGCAGGSAAGAEYVIRWADSTVSSAYPDEASARVALARSGKTGIVKKK